MVELIPKESPQIPTWLNALFYFALLVLFSSIISFFILGNAIKAGQDKFQELRLVFLEERTVERIALEKQVLSYEKKINDFSVLAPYHLETSRLFNFLEKITHPKVWLSKMNFDAERGRVSSSGVTQSFESLGQQILILQAETLVGNINLEKVSIDRAGNINFDLSFSVSTTLLK